MTIYSVYPWDDGVTNLFATFGDAMMHCEKHKFRRARIKEIVLKKGFYQDSVREWIYSKNREQETVNFSEPRKLLSTASKIS